MVAGYNYIPAEAKAFLREGGHWLLQAIGLSVC